MELIICHSILEHLNMHNILNPIQHGFRPGLSSQTHLIDEILRAMDQNYQVDLIVFFSKAFNTVAHKKLLLKLEHFGIQLLLTVGYKHGSQTELRKLLKGKKHGLDTPHHHHHYLLAWSQKFLSMPQIELVCINLLYKSVWWTLCYALSAAIRLKLPQLIVIATCCSAIKLSLPPYTSYTDQYAVLM